MLSERFTPENVSAIEATKMIREAFPDSQHKQMSKDGVRSTYIIGVDMATESGSWDLQRVPSSTDSRTGRAG